MAAKTRQRAATGADARATGAAAPDVARTGETVTPYEASEPGGVLLVLAHGAGAGQRHPFMVGVAKGLASRGIDVATFDFPYMQARRPVPDKAPVLEASFRAAIDAARARPGMASRRLFIGGKSMGGRMATHLAAQRLEALFGVVVFGYPLHPPGRPDKPRVEHLPDITVPVLILQGERDTFGTPAELEAPLRTMTAKVTLHAVAGADHSLAVRGRTREAVFESVVAAAAEWMYAASGAR
jgi:predicted alpha/beta-hydrolase family hydrolase